MSSVPASETVPTAAHMREVAQQFLDEQARDRRAAKHLAHYVLALIDEANVLRTHLAILEWVSVPGPVPEVRCCPVPECGVAKGGRHAPTCWLAEAINAPRG